MSYFLGAAKDNKNLGNIRSCSLVVGFSYFYTSVSSDIISHTYTPFAPTVLIQLYSLRLYLIFPWHLSNLHLSSLILCTETCTFPPVSVSDFFYPPCMSWHSSCGGNEGTEERLSLPLFVALAAAAVRGCMDNQSLLENSHSASAV